MAAIPKLSLPETLGAAVAPIANLTDEEFKRLRGATSTRRAFSIKASAAKELASEIPSLSATLPFTLGALTFLYSRLEPYRDSAPLANVVAQIIEDFEIKCAADDRPKLERRLIELLGRNESFEQAKKLQRLERGFLPNATAFRSFVDLRPDFGGEETVKFSGFLKIVQFRIRTDSDSKRSREFVFQVTEEALDELQQAIDRARAKLRAVDEIPSIAKQIIT